MPSLQNDPNGWQVQPELSCFMHMSCKDAIRMQHPTMGLFCHTIELQVQDAFSMHSGNYQLKICSLVLGSQQCRIMFLRSVFHLCKQQMVVLD